MCLTRHWDGFPLGLGLVVEDKPTELSCDMYSLHDWDEACTLVLPELEDLFTIMGSLMSLL